ncbi:uncharacterized protein B0H18DRAFT_989967 [Fomitopsis serialis]|uniref:uncharacterized protein n=1 Tax=Fomitopsis serialis TaxID=139415 RepID=UPI002008427B|nr:uncharacterized protein B0H18DRAFT_989967 [Neoantrodia serialis]KAH9931561.1 hypothetical protein B0H18DRAFT_989967 [Neoantrodia serialis]
MSQTFLDLPLELLPVIMQQLVRPSHFAALCLVNKAFYTFAIPYLYERAFIYAWHKEGKAKVVRLFRTLSSCPHLAKHVQRLEIRDFPKSFYVVEHEATLQLCLSGIKNCVNLRSCTWTRDGSLTTEILEALLPCAHLEELEINGNHENYYDPWLLRKFTHLRRISLIMPRHAVTDVLPTWTSATGGVLRHLTILCKTPGTINDAILQEMAPNIPNVERLYIAGCVKVTEHGIWAIIAQNTHGLLALGMEGLSPSFDMANFSDLCARHNALARLRSITLTVDGSPTWKTDVLSLLHPAPLEQFHISTIGGDVGPAFGEEFCNAIVDRHGRRLRRFSVHRLRMNLASVNYICRGCEQLEQLFVVIEQGSLGKLGPILAQARGLRAVHVNRPLDLGSEDVPMIARDQILSIVKQSGPNLMQFGYNTRVFQVERIVRKKEDGSLESETRLGPYESPEVPEQFLVVRT